VLVPTAQTRALPLPVAIRVLARIKGEGLYATLCSLTSNFSTYSGSPVKAASSADTSVAERIMQSAGTFMPDSI